MAFFSSTATVPQNLTFVSSNKLSFSPSSTTSFNFVSFPSFQSKFCKTITTSPQITRAHAPPAPSTETTTASSFHGLCYVVGDNIDTDQIIPAEHLTLVPSKPDEYQKLGSFALIGLPDSYTVRFVEPGETKTKYSIIIGGANFGCGSSREHAPVALGASGAAAVVRNPMRGSFSGTRWLLVRCIRWNQRRGYARSVAREMSSLSSSLRIV
jgi:3-isopropylmalate/(R)-2-methylmalate dehydratase small subunit